MVETATGFTLGCDHCVSGSPNEQAAFNFEAAFGQMKLKEGHGKEVLLAIVESFM